MYIFLSFTPFLVYSPYSDLAGKMQVYNYKAHFDFLMQQALMVSLPHQKILL